MVAKFVVGEHHGGRLPRHVGAGCAHGYADVGAAQGGRVVDAVAGHGHHVPLGAKRVGDTQLRLGWAAGEDDLFAAGKDGVQVGLGHGVQLRSGDNPKAVMGDADPAGDLSGGQAVVAGDHDQSDPGGTATGDGAGDLRARWIEHGYYAQQGQLPLGGLALGRDRFAGR
jgi:hypothetical protein